MAGNNRTDRLMARFFSGEALPEEAMELSDWAGMSPENEAYFRGCSDIFSMNLVITHDDKFDAWEKIQQAFKSRSKPTVFNWRLIGVAASVVVIVLAGLLINDHFKRPGLITYKAAATSRKVLLKDQSEIIISPGSAVTIDRKYGVNDRKIELRGSAVFSVVHDPRRTFIVDVNALHVKDIGTIFSIKTSSTGDTIFINVTEGAISVYDDFGVSKNVDVGGKVIYIGSRKVLEFVQTERDSSTTIADAGEENTREKAPHASAKFLSNTNHNDSLLHIDSSLNNDFYGSYPSSYSTDEGYTPEGRRALRRKDSVETKRITNDMLKDGLITRGKPLSFLLSNTDFIVNGKAQSDAVLRRYRQRYIPASQQKGKWVWSHNLHQQDMNPK